MKWCGLCAQLIDIMLVYVVIRIGKTYVILKILKKTITFTSYNFAISISNFPNWNGNLHNSQLLEPNETIPALIWSNGKLSMELGGSKTRLHTLCDH